MTRDRLQTNEVPALFRPALFWPALFRSAVDRAGAPAVLLDERGYAALSSSTGSRAGYTAGPLFRASINGRGGPPSCDAAHHRRQSYCAGGPVRSSAHRQPLSRRAASCRAPRAGYTVAAAGQGLEPSPGSS